MAGYWIKLYQEILDDPKMATMSDHLWRRTIELFLVAGKSFADGNMPEAKQIAWLLRTDEASLLADLEQLVIIGIISKTENGWIVNKFAERQAAVPDKDRKAQQRERDRREQYYVTNNNTKGHERVTKCDTDTDIDKDKNGDTEVDSHPGGSTTAIPVHDQVLIPNFSQIAAVLNEADLRPTSKRLRVLRSAMQNVNIGGFPAILSAANNLARSPAPESIKRYDWLLNGFDYEERITEFLTTKNGPPKPKKYTPIPDDWEAEHASTAVAS